jgi:hypothetical protein
MRSLSTVLLIVAALISSPVLALAVLRDPATSALED